jgi:hypothetical protein
MYEADRAPPLLSREPTGAAGGWSSKVIRDSAPDADRWFRRWCTFLATCLLVGLLLPLPSRITGNSRSYSDHVPALAYPAVLGPCLLALAAILGARGGRAYAPLFFVVGVGAFAWNAWVSLEPPSSVVATRLVGGWLGISAIAAGVHARRRHLDSRAGALVAGLGGLALLASLLLTGDGRGISLRFPGARGRVDPIEILLVCLLLLYAALGMLQAFLKPGEGVLAFTAGLARGGFWIPVFGAALVPIPFLIWDLSILAVWKTEGVYLGLLASASVGLAGWLEGRDEVRLASTELESVFG